MHSTGTTGRQGRGRCTHAHWQPPGNGDGRLSAAHGTACRHPGARHTNMFAHVQFIHPQPTQQLILTSAAALPQPQAAAAAPAPARTDGRTPAAQPPWPWPKLQSRQPLRGGLSLARRGWRAHVRPGPPAGAARGPRRAGSASCQCRTPPRRGGGASLCCEVGGPEPVPVVGVM